MQKRRFISVALAVILALAFAAPLNPLAILLAEASFSVTLRPLVNSASPTLTLANWGTNHTTYAMPFVAANTLPPRTITSAGTHFLGFVVGGSPWYFNIYNQNARGLTVNVDTSGRIRAAAGEGDAGSGRPQLSHIPGDPEQVTYISFGTVGGLPSGHVSGQFPSILIPRYGHVTNGTHVTAEDITQLRRFVAATNRTVFINNNIQRFNESNADANADGIINSADITLLRRYVASQGSGTVRLGPPPPRFCVSLTFDDGPNDNYTVQILDTLDRYNAKASFYVLGSLITPQTTPILQRMIATGHSVENHSWAHEGFWTRSRDDAREILVRTNNAIIGATGVQPFSFRAPELSWGDGLIGLDTELNLWNHCVAHDTNDWRGPSAREMADAIINRAYNGGLDGGLILFHDGGGNRQPTADSIELFVPQLQAMGYNFVTVPELHQIKNSSPAPFTGRAAMPRPNAWVPNR